VLGGAGSPPVAADGWQTPAGAFDGLYCRAAPGLVGQAYLLTGRRALARESVERAFHLAWQRWPEVAVDADPTGWVRAATYEHAMAPWQRFRPVNRREEPPPGLPEDRILLSTLLALPPAYRRTLVLYDCVRLGLPETAAELEATTTATTRRLVRARQAVAERLPALGDPDLLRTCLEQLAERERLQAPEVSLVRAGAEQRTRFWTTAAITLTVLIIGSTVVTLRTAPTHYEAPLSRAHPIAHVPPLMGPGPLTESEKSLREALRSHPGNTPHRLAPQSW
jgi:DNA-directed RNA polymerase specialized sigma24 family protein